MEPNNMLVIDSNGNWAAFYLDDQGHTNHVVWNRKENKPERLTFPVKEVQEFYLDIDSNDNIHLVGITSSKKVLYLRHYHNKWAAHQLYDFSTTAGAKISNVKIASVNSELHLLYVISVPSGDMALFHHHWTSNQWEGYRVTDANTADGQLIYDIHIHAKHLYLALYDGKDISIWQFSQGNWKKQTENINTHQIDLKSITLQEDYMLLGNSQGVYFIKNIHDSSLPRPITIVEEANIDKGPVIINKRKTLYAAWLSDGEVYYRASYDGGTSWGRVRRYPYISGERVEEYNFANNYSPLVKTKKVFATPLAHLHIPFVQKPGEKVRMMPERNIAEDPGEKDQKYQPAGGSDTLNDIPERTYRPESMISSRNINIDHQKDILLELKQLRNLVKEESDRTINAIASLKEEITSKIDKETGALLREIKCLEEQLSRITRIANHQGDTKKNIIIP